MKGKIGKEEGAWGAILSITLSNYQAYDGSKYAGVSFYAKHGAKSTPTLRFNVPDGQTVQAGGICKQCWNHFGKDITLTPQWKQYTVSLAELTQGQGWGDPRPPTVDPARLWQLAWHVSEKGADFDIYVDQVRLMKCKE
jgi:hypothetical protein